MAIPFIDLCSGIGGFHSGLVNTGHYRCVGHAEIDKNAEKAYNAIYGEEGGLNYGDLRTINPRELPHFDLLCGGFPCQSFSVAGRRLGFRDTRGTVFFEIARILAEKRPPFLLLENVLGLLSHDSGRTLNTSSPRLLKWGIISNGWCLTANTSESPNSEGGCILSDILIRDVPERYFLSAAAMRKILSNLYRDRRAKESTKQTE